jgi:hypothetical protein
MKMDQNTKRAKTRKLLLFFCVYNAYKELDIKVNPADLGDIFGLTPGQLQKTESMFSHLQTGYKSVKHKIGVDDYITDFCIKIGLDDYIDDIIRFTNHIILKHNELSQSASQPLAAGMIRYYMRINGIDLNDKLMLAEVSRRSDTTIEAMYKKICSLDNS